MTLEQKQTLKEFGLHRADVMQGRLEALQAELADMERDYLTIIEAQDAEQQPDVTRLVEALERFIEWYEPLRLGDEPAFQFYDMSKKALAKYNEMMGDKK